jgi:hypothetical protein
MNLRRFENLEIRLGAPQLLVLGVALTFVIFVAYYLGLFAGRSVGIKVALEGTAHNVVKLPVAGGLNDGDLPSGSGGDGVYASLKYEKPSKRLDESHGPLTPQPLSEAGIATNKPAEDSKTIAEESLGQSRDDSKTNVFTSKLSHEKTNKKKVEFSVEQTLSIRKSSTKTLQEGWYCQVLASQTQSDSQSIAQKLRASGFPVVLEEAIVNGKSYFRVLVGPESTREMATRLVDQLKREPSVTSKPFIRLVR